MAARRKRILVVCHWPLGGIRTYLKYVYGCFPRSEYDITLLVSPTIESEVLKDDFQDTGLTVIEAPLFRGNSMLACTIAKELVTRGADLIHSQGFISAFHTSLAHRLHRSPHIMTIHGILEPRYLQGRMAGLKAMALRFAMNDVDVFHGVGHDILQETCRQIPYINSGSKTLVVIPNGIDSDHFRQKIPNAKQIVNEVLSVESKTIVFGFFGRFMQQKGFDVILKSCQLLGESIAGHPYRILAVGSGDYESHYKAMAKRLGVLQQIRFHPFISDIRPLVQGCDAVLMPSNWEAYGLLASEVLCSGKPLVASTCIGLRETIKDTPTLQINAGDEKALANAMRRIAVEENLQEKFMEFSSEAAARFDINQTVIKTQQLFNSLI